MKKSGGRKVLSDYEVAISEHYGGRDTRSRREDKLPKTSRALSTERGGVFVRKRRPSELD